MGSGKSTVTPRLARGLGYDSMDLDAEISRFLGMSIPAIFDVLGESEFRSTESSKLRETAALSNVVVSLGGGSVNAEENLRFCIENGYLVYLRASVSFLSDRLSVSLRNRPKLFSADGEMLEGDALEARVDELLATRVNHYESAHLIVDIDDKTPPEIVRAIQQSISNARPD